VNTVCASLSGLDTLQNVPLLDIVQCDKVLIQIVSNACLWQRSCNLGPSCKTTSVLEMLKLSVATIGMCNVLEQIHAQVNNVTLQCQWKRSSKRLIRLWPVI